MSKEDLGHSGCNSGLYADALASCKVAYLTLLKRAVVNMASTEVCMEEPLDFSFKTRARARIEPVVASISYSSEDTESSCDTVSSDRFEDQSTGASYIFAREDSCKSEPSDDGNSAHEYDDSAEHASAHGTKPKYMTKYSAYKSKSNEHKFKINPSIMKDLRVQIIERRVSKGLGPIDTSPEPVKRYEVRIS